MTGSFIHTFLLPANHRMLAIVVDCFFAKSDEQTPVQFLPMVLKQTACCAIVDEE